MTTDTWTKDCGCVFEYGADDAPGNLRAACQQHAPENRRALRERLICAALTGLLAQFGGDKLVSDVAAARAVAQADAVLARLDAERS